jgi:hypothetical protein
MKSELMSHVDATVMYLLYVILVHVKKYIVYHVSVSTYHLQTIENSQLYIDVFHNIMFHGSIGG